MDLELEAKVALVTGASKGIGRAIALALAREGCRVALAARPSPELDETAAAVEQAGGDGFAAAADLSRPEQIEQMVRAVDRRFGRIDILVNCAGAAAGGDLFSLTDADWFSAFELKVMGYMRTARSVVPVMRRSGGGRIVMIAGTAGRQPGPATLCVGAVNAALLNATRSLAEALAGDGIGVVAVSPGPTDTERRQRLEAASAYVLGIPLAEMQDRTVRQIPLGRVARPEEVADLVAYLASPLAAYMTGVNVTLDGGAVKVI